MKLSQIVETLEAKVLTGNDLLETDIDTCGASDLMSDILAGLSEGCILLTGLTTVQVIRTAMVAGVGAVVFVRDKTPPPGGHRSGPGAGIALNLEPLFNVCILRPALRLQLDRP